MLKNVGKAKVIAVTGKGGVGKTSFALALARASAQGGKKTLLVELGERSYFSELFGGEVSFAPRSVEKNLDIALWDGKNSLKEFVTYYLKIRKLVDLFFSNKVMSALIKGAPALKEIAVLGKLTSGIRQVGPQMDYDLIILDAYASGHFLSLLRVPEGMSQAIRFGPMGEQSRNIHEVLKNKELFRIFIVTLPETLPVQEALELNEYLRKDFSQDAIFVCNRILEIPVSQEELQQSLRTEEKGKEFKTYLLNRMNKQNKSLDLLKERSTNVIKIPFFYHTSYMQKVEQIRVALESQWKV